MSDVSCSELTPTGALRAGRLRSHGMHHPTASDVRHALWAGTTEVVGRTWAEACERAGLPGDLVDPTPEQLERIIGALVDSAGTVGLVGRAMRVRVETYREIAARGVEGTAPDWDWARAAMDALLRGRMLSAAAAEEIVALDPFAEAMRVELDQAAARVAQQLRTAMGGVHVVLGGAQCVAGGYGGTGTWFAAAGGSPIEWSFCAMAVRDREPYVVPDLRADALHRLNPVVLHDSVRSYAGAPLVTSRGEVVGTCCVIDTVPREFADAEVRVLVEEAGRIVAKLEARREDRDATAARRGGRTDG